MRSSLNAPQRRSHQGSSIVVALCRSRCSCATSASSTATRSSRATVAIGCSPCTRRFALPLWSPSGGIGRGLALGNSSQVTTLASARIMQDLTPVLPTWGSPHALAPIAHPEGSVQRQERESSGTAGAAHRGGAAPRPVPPGGCCRPARPQRVLLQPCPGTPRASPHRAGSVRQRVPRPTRWSHAGCL